jgi:hypothetical protein
VRGDSPVSVVRGALPSRQYRRSSKDGRARSFTGAVSSFETRLRRSSGRGGFADDRRPCAWRRPTTRAFSTFGLRDGKLAVVESVNKAGDHTGAKRIIGTTKTLTPDEAAGPAFDLWCLAKR